MRILFFLLDWVRVFKMMVIVSVPCFVLLKQLYLANLSELYIIIVANQEAKKAARFFLDLQMKICLFVPWYCQSVLMFLFKYYLLCEKCRCNRLLLLQTKLKRRYYVYAHASLSSLLLLTVFFQVPPARLLPIVLFQI